MVEIMTPCVSTKVLGTSFDESLGLNWVLGLALGDLVAILYIWGGSRPEADRCLYLE